MTETPNGADPLSDALPYTHPVRPAALSTSAPTSFELVPSAQDCNAIAAYLGLTGLRKLRFTGALRPLGKRDWQMQAQLGATVVQDCVVTLAPVTTRLEDTVDLRWLQNMPETDTTLSEVEMAGDVSTEPLTEVIDLGQVMIEALALALPQYPRAEGAQTGELIFTEPDAKPMTDEDAKPFAGLAALRDKFGDNSDSDDGEGGEGGAA